MGAIRANLELAKKTLADMAGQGADILLFPELFLTGYFPDDLLFKPRFVADAMAAAEDFAKATAGTSVTAIMPCVWQENGHLFNAALVCENGRIIARRYKRELPNDDVFYEKRYFERADLQEPVTIKGVSIGIPICEDIWHPDVCAHLVDNGARILLCPLTARPIGATSRRPATSWSPTASPRTMSRCSISTRSAARMSWSMTARALPSSPVAASVVQAKSFEPEIMMSNWQRTPDGWRCTDPHVTPLSSVDEAPWRACVLGLRDYVEKNGFKSVLLGLLGRHRQRRRRRHGRRCHRRRSRPLPDAALPLHQQGKPRRRRGLRPAGSG